MVGRRVHALGGARWLLRALLAGVTVSCSSTSPQDEATPDACPDGYAACGDQCLDLATSAQSCGACGLACAPGEQCSGGACQCQEGLTSCAGQCANLQGDGNNCGSCGTACPSDRVCAAGVCSAEGCPDGQLQCGTSCVSADSDPLNCGSCGATCAAPMTCAGATCVCPAGTALCGGQCVVTATDLANCGACGTVCSGGATCSNGSCVGGTGGGPSTGGTGGAGGNETGGGGTGGVLVNPACPGTAALAYQGAPSMVPGTVEAEDFDPAGYSDSSPSNEGGAYRTDVEVDLKALGAGYAIGWMTAGEWLEYTVNVPTAGDYTLTVRAGAVDAGRTLAFSECGVALGTLTVPQVAAWGEMATASLGTVHLEAGLQVIRATVGASDFLDFDSFTLDLVSAGTGGTGGGGTGGTGGATGGTGGTVVACSTGTAQAGDVTVSVSSLQQKISGFGVSTAWAGDFRDPARDPDTLWSTTTGAGLTLHRIRIGRGSTSETRIAQKAVEYGVKVWATPWEVSREFIDRDQCPGNSSCEPPPKLIDPQGWADQIVDFVGTMQAAGVPIYAISAENEPDSGGMNGTTSFTAAEMATWIGTYLGPALAGTNTKLMAPETMNWWSFPEYFAAIQNNSAAWDHVSIFASHEYGRGPSAPEPAIVAAGKEYWQTEVDTGTTSDDPTGDNMPSALKLAEDIHNDLTRANLNAWHYWWLYAGGSSGLFDTNTNVWTKRFWIMGNFSRFVRPGYLRVSTTGTAPSGVLLSAYTNPVDGTVVVVAINKNTAATPVSLFISDMSPCTMTPWVTSDTDSIVAKAPIAVTSARFTASLEARSVTTFVGRP